MQDILGCSVLDQEALWLFLIVYYKNFTCAPQFLLVGGFTF